MAEIESKPLINKKWFDIIASKTLGVIGMQDSQYKKILEEYLNQNESLRLSIQYCLETYKKLQEQGKEQVILGNFGQYAPKEISKQILKPQLKQIQKHFQKLPKKCAKIQHFLIILILVMDIKFQQIPKYLIGLVSMFKRIKNSQQKVLYEDFFKYIIGQIINLQEDDQNTQFQIQFEQNKKQDYLLHDNGIKKIYYSKDNKFYIVLDNNSDQIKIYNTEMKILSRYMPNKDRHNNRNVKIKYFDYNEFSNKLGLAMADNTFEYINLVNYLTKPRELFQSTYLNYEIFSTEDEGSIVHLEFVQMTNKWLGLSAENRLYMYHPEKKKDSNQQFVKQIILWNDPKQQLKITDIIQIVPLSLICIVASNKIYFFNQNLTEFKWENYVHGSIIKKVRYCQEIGSFYILAQQKVLTILTVERNSHAFKLQSYPLDHSISDFEIFPYFNTILFTDLQNYIHLYDIHSVFCYKSALYSQIVKSSKNKIKLIKTSKNQYLIYESYMISMTLQKLAIQKQIQYQIDQNIYFNEQKQQIVLSINHQILRLNLLNSEIVKIYSNESYQMSKYLKYVIDQKDEIILMDNGMNVMYLEKKERNKNKNKSQLLPFKHIQIDFVNSMAYNKQNKLIYVMGRNQLFEIKNINKNLNIVRQLLFQNLDQIISTQFIFQKNLFYFVTVNDQYYFLELDSFNLIGRYRFSFPKDKKIVEDVCSVVSYYLAKEEIVVTLTNNNQLLVASLVDTKVYGLVNLLEGVTYKQVDIDFKFVKLVVSQNQNNQSSKISNKNSKKTNQRGNTIVYLTTTDGHFMQLNIQPFIDQILKKIQFSLNEKQFPHLTQKAVQTNKSKYLFNLNFIKAKTVKLQAVNTFTFPKGLSIFQKRHQRQIMIMKSMFIQKNLTLTISKQGQIKIYDNNKPLCILRLPNLKKKFQNTEDLQRIQISKIQKQVVRILNQMKSYYQKPKETPRQILTKIKSIKEQNQQLTKFNHKEPIAIDIENKNIQKIVLSDQVEENYMKKNFSMTNYQTSLQSKRKGIRIHLRNKSNFNKTQQQFTKKFNSSFSHPWRQKKQFKQIYSNLPSQTKYKKKIPNQLLYLRRSLDMVPKEQLQLDKNNPEKKADQILNQYELGTRIFGLNKNKQLNKPEQQQEVSQILNDKKQDFQSCYYIKSARKMKKCTGNDFDDIDKEFFKKQIKFNRKFIAGRSVKNNGNQQESPDNKFTALQFGLESRSRFNNTSRSISMKRNRKQESVLDYNMMPYRTNSISAVLQLFEKHNKQVLGTKNSRQININNEMRQLKNMNFMHRY